MLLVGTRLFKLRKELAKVFQRAWIDWAGIQTGSSASAGFIIFSCYFHDRAPCILFTKRVSSVHLQPVWSRNCIKLETRTALASNMTFSIIDTPWKYIFYSLLRIFASLSTLSFLCHLFKVFLEMIKSCLVYILIIAWLFP